MSALVRFSRSLIKTNLLINNSPVVVRRYSSKDNSLDNVANVEIPSYEPNELENIVTKKARLLYQSRKRGMLENDLILSTFAYKYLAKMSVEQTNLYDILINLPSNDWDIYNWATGNKPTPPQFENEVMTMLKEHVRNDKRDIRLRQPDLP